MESLLIVMLRKITQNRADTQEKSPEAEAPRPEGGGCGVQSSPWRVMPARYSVQSAKRSRAIFSAAVRVAVKMFDRRQYDISVKCAYSCALWV